MGTFLHPITIRNPRTGRSAHLEAVVDSGATFTSAPGSVLASLGIPIARRVTMQLADGSLVETPVGNVEVIVDGEAAPSICLFGEENSPVLLGATTMQSLLVTPDVVNHRLVKVPGLLVSGPVVFTTEEGH